MEQKTFGFIGVGRMLFGELDQGGDAERAVQVNVQVGLGKSMDEVGCEFGHGPFSWTLQAARSLWFRGRG